MIGVLRFAWRAKWNLLRLAVAVFLVWVLAADTGGRLARLQLAALPDFDYAAEVASLRAIGRYGEAGIVAKAGIEALGDRVVAGDTDAAAERERIETELAAVERERASVLRRVKAAGVGALTGRGDSLEGLLGAIATDFFIVGDVRDIVIEGGRLALDGETDEVILALSTVGIVTTLTPQFDVAAAVLKAARRMGVMGDGLARSVVRMVKAKEARAVESLLGDTAKLADAVSPAGAVRMLRFADEPADVARMARFAERPRGGFALLVAGDESAALLKRGVEGEVALLKVAGKGKPGVRLLSMPAGRRLLRPHPLVGVAKSVWKGNAAALVERIVDRMGAGAWWMLPLAAAWVVVEVGLLLMRRVRGRAAAGSVTQD